MAHNPATIEARTRILQSEVFKLIEKLNRCVDLAAHGDDFHDAWEVAMLQQTELLGQLHRWKISLVGLPDSEPNKELSI